MIAIDDKVSFELADGIRTTGLGCAIAGAIGAQVRAAVVATPSPEPTPSPDAGMVRCGRCGGPAGYLGVRCERVGGCRVAEERVAAMVPEVISRGMCPEGGFLGGVIYIIESAQIPYPEKRGPLMPGMKSEPAWFLRGPQTWHATLDGAIAAWREEMLAQERGR